MCDQPCRFLIPVRILMLSAVVAGLFLQAEFVSAEQKTFNNSLGMSFVLIPAGSFTMGSPEGEFSRSANETRHQVTITRPFYMQETEVTVGQWRELMGSRWFGDVDWPQAFPIGKVSWYDVRQFIKKLNAKKEGHYRLPTEAEWEYAARAGSTGPYPWGDKIECRRAMYSNSLKGSSACRNFNSSKGFKHDMPAPVKQYPPNDWGLFDMHGNVWEWCQDLFTNYQSGSVIDPNRTDSGTNRVRRGGSWFKHGYSCRSANRAYGHAASRLPHTGFRLVRETQAAPGAEKAAGLPRPPENSNQKGP